VKPGKLEKALPFTLDELQTSHLLASLADEPLKYQTLGTMAIFTGMRRGELLGLTWDSIDIDNCVILVDKTSQHTTTEGIDPESNTKTSSSIRNIPLPKTIVPLLKELKKDWADQKEKCCDLWVENNLLFRQFNGKPMHPNTVDSWFDKFRKRIDLPKGATFHDLRHTSATMMLINGVDLATVSSILGHARVSTTADFYLGAVESAKVAAINKLDDLFGEKNSIDKQEYK